MNGAQTTAARDAEPSRPAASAIDTLVAHLQRLRYEDLPAEAVAAARTFLLDAIGVGLSGSRHPRMPALKRAAAALGQGAEATVSAPQGVPADSENLGLLLVSAEYYRRLRERLEHQDKEIEHLKGAVHNLGSGIDQLRGELRDELRSTTQQVLYQTYDISAKIDRVEATVKPFFRTVAQHIKRIRRG